MPPRVLASGPKPCGGNKDKKRLSKVTSFTIHHVYSYREVPMFLLNLLRRTLWLFLLNHVTSG